MDITLRENLGLGEEPRKDRPHKHPRAMWASTAGKWGEGGMLKAEGCDQGTVLQPQEPHIRAGHGDQETK